MYIFNNCYYVFSIIKNIISISFIDLEGFSFQIRNRSISFYRDDVFFGCATMINDIYVLDLTSSILNIDTKRLKSNNPKDSYLWHYHLGHVSEKRLIKLHKDGYLGSFNWESIEECELCLLSKMTKSPL